MRKKPIYQRPSYPPEQQLGPYLTKEEPHKAIQRYWGSDFNVYYWVSEANTYGEKPMRKVEGSAAHALSASFDIVLFFEDPNHVPELISGSTKPGTEQVFWLGINVAMLPPAALKIILNRYKLTDRHRSLIYEILAVRNSPSMVNVKPEGPDFTMRAMRKLYNNPTGGSKVTVAQALRTRAIRDPNEPYSEKDINLLRDLAYKAPDDLPGQVEPFMFGYINYETDPPTTVPPKSKSELTRNAAAIPLDKNPDMTKERVRDRVERYNEANRLWLIYETDRRKNGRAALPI
jgi:hypothetical protein